MEKLDFGQVLTALTAGEKLQRTGWNGKGMWIELQVPDEHSKMTRPYIFMCIPFGSSTHFENSKKDIERIPWIPSQTDLFAKDWKIIN